MLMLIHYTLLQFLNCMNECLAIDSGGFLHTNSLYVLTAVWLSASYRGRDGVQVNRCGVNCSEQLQTLTTTLCQNLALSFNFIHRNVLH